ncbi:MAG: type II secretion system minor pseudopilin GspJ [Thiomargarita sp.]|nr:type II secretion system minor pseudopilin GspJ [Thiomargarita sp.]
MSKCPKALQAFTLLELLVAMTIFAFIAVMAYAGLNTILTARLQTDQHATELAHLLMTFTWLGRDIEQLIERPIRDQYGDKQPILQGTISTLELTRAGWRNPLQQKRSSLQRVAYFIENNTLWRTYWWVLDRAQDTHPIKMDLLNDVNTLKLRYLDENFKWYEQWPPLDFTTPLDKNNVKPILQLKAIEVTLTVDGWGDIIRLFRAK